MSSFDSLEKSRRALLGTASVAAVMMVLATSAVAADGMWTGAASQYWENSANWQGGVVPGTNDTASFQNGRSNVVISTGGSNLYIGALNFLGSQIFTIENLGNSHVYLSEAGITTGSGGSNPIIQNRGSWTFTDNASAAGAAIINSVGWAVPGGGLFFAGSSTAADATITNTADGLISFRNFAKAGNARIFNEGELRFYSASSADNATITTKAGGRTFFFNNTQGGTARLITEGGGIVNISVLDTVASLTVGAIEGAGAYHLGSRTLIVNSATTDEVSGVISGTSGSLTKRGTGTLILSGQNTYTGTTTVEGGSLIVNGSTASSAETIVSAGGTLGGAGTVGALSVQGGTVAPGHNGIGTLSVQGNVQFGPGSVFQVQVTPAGQNDKLAATGSATLNGGTVAVQAQSGTYAPSTTYTILTADGGVTGGFDQLTHDFAFLTPSLKYNANDVQLIFARNSTQPGDVGNNPNQGETGQGVGGSENNNLGRAFLSLTRSEAQQALGQLSGEIYATAQGIVAYQDELVRRALLARMMSFSTPALPPGLAAVSQSSVAYAADLAPRSAPVATPVAAAPGLGIETWGQVFGSWGNTESSAAHAGVDRSTGGFLVGADAGLAGAWRAGLAGGYSRTSFDMPGVLSSGAVESVHVAAYGAGSLGAVQLRAGAAYTHSDIDVSRSVAFRGFSDALTGSFDSRSAVVFGEVGYRFGFGGVSLEPFAGLSHLHVESDAYAEEGGLAALTGQARDFAVTASTLGLRAAVALPVGSGALSAKGMLGWRHGFGDLVPVTVHRFVAGDTPFAVSGAPLDRDALVVEAGLDWAVTPLLTVGVKYDGQIGQRDQEHALRGQASLRF